MLENDSTANCKVYSDLIAESSSGSNLAWFLEGNGTCNGSEYRCFGPESYNGDFWTVDLLRESTAPKSVEGLDETDAVLWDYSSVVDNCIA